MTNYTNPLCAKVGLLVRDLMAIDEKFVLMGRENRPQDDFVTGFIAIDQLGASLPQCATESFDADEEVMTYSTLMKSTVTIEFYGDDAYHNANRLTGLLRSQAAYDKKVALGINVFNVSSLTDLKQLTGAQYGNRLQMSLVVQDGREVKVGTLRIDTPQLRIITEDEEITP